MSAANEPPRRVLFILGTRPEVVKLAPLIAEMRGRGRTFDVHVCSTGQHRELIADALAAFDLIPDDDLALMQPEQTPVDLLGRTLLALSPVLAATRPGIVVVQGDTTTALAGSMAAYYAKVPVAHVEAGLRSGDPLAPFPEEQHRRTIDLLARWLFAPTELARRALLREGHPADHIYVTGNTGIDALRILEGRSAEPTSVAELDALLRERGVPTGGGRRLVVATVHRREQVDGPLAEIGAGLAEIAADPDVDVLLPVHPNPAIRRQLERALEGSAVRRIPALSPVGFVGLLRRADLVITDSGGVQEEAATLGVPALIVRRRTDRPESVEHGISRVVGRDPAAIATAALDVLGRPRAAHVPSDIFGDGQAAVRIADVLAIGGALA